VLCSFCIFTIALAETQYRRTPPFGVAQDTNSASRNLGDYTHSHETVDKSTYSCYSIGECQICDPLEKVTLTKVYARKKYCNNYL
jgi:hypothetical protein